MALRCSHGMLSGLCVVEKCPHWDRGRTPRIGDDGTPRTYTRSARLHRGGSRSPQQGVAHPGFQDLTGQRFGHPIVESRAPNVSGNARWRCQLDCGRALLPQKTDRLGAVSAAESGSGQPNHGGTMALKLSSGEVALVDVDVFEWASRYRWQAKRKTGCRRVYVQRSTHIDGKRVCWTLHRLIMKPAAGQHVDHINGDALDNRRANLRICSPRENSANVCSSKLQKRGRFKGVFWNVRGKRWEAAIGGGEVMANGKRRRVYLGLFNDPADAARAYDAAALRVFGAFAALNFPEEARAHG